MRINYTGGLMARITRFELTRVLSARSLQLSLGAPPLVKRTAELSMLQVAEKELDQNYPQMEEAFLSALQELATLIFNRNNRHRLVDPCQYE